MESLNFLLILLFLVGVAKGNPPSVLYSTNISDVAVQNSCPPWERIPNSNVQIRSLYFLGPIAAVITCHENYSLVGSSVTYCDDGAWNFGSDKIPPKCERRCPPPPILEHGKVDLEKVFKDVYSQGTSYLQGTVAKYTCYDGYILQPLSSSARFCENGSWTGTDAFCNYSMEVTCGSPPIIANGYSSFPESFPIEYSLNYVGQETVYKCEMGYKLLGSNKIKCTEQGIWMPKAPSCHKETGNPFADFGVPAPAAAPPVSNGVPDFFAAQPATNPAAYNQSMWGNNAASANTFQAPAQQPTQQPFNDLTGFFNTNEPSVFDPLAPTDQKQPPTAPPLSSMPPQRPPQPSKILTGDLESSLNSLVENLTMDSSGGKWNSPKNQPRTVGWQPQPMAATTAASYRPMMGAQQPQMMGQSQVMQPMMGAPMQYPMGAVQQQPQMMGSPKMGAPGTQPQQQAFDPFGAL